MGQRLYTMIGRVPSPALPDARPVRRLVGPAQSLNCLQGHRAAGAAARSRRAAPRPYPAPAGLGRPGDPRRADLQAVGVRRVILNGLALPSRYLHRTAGWSYRGRGNRQGAVGADPSGAGLPRCPSGARGPCAAHHGPEHAAPARVTALPVRNLQGDRDRQRPPARRKGVPATAARAATSPGPQPVWMSTWPRSSPPDWRDPTPRSCSGRAAAIWIRSSRRLSGVR